MPTFFYSDADSNKNFRFRCLFRFLLFKIHFVFCDKLTKCFFSKPSCLISWTIHAQCLNPHCLKLFTINHFKLKIIYESESKIICTFVLLICFRKHEYFFFYFISIFILLTRRKAVEAQIHRASK